MKNICIQNGVEFEGQVKDEMVAALADDIARRLMPKDVDSELHVATYMQIKDVIIKHLERLMS